MTATREDIVAEAMTWLGTPFHHAARIKGVGVDCANLLIGVYSAVGLIQEFDLAYYPADWHIHQKDPRFLTLVRHYADRCADGQPGDIAMFKFGRQPAHGAIVIGWPMVIHAWAETHCVDMTEGDRGALGARFAGFYRLRGLA